MAETDKIKKMAVIINVGGSATGKRGVKLGHKIQAYNSRHNLNMAVYYTRDEKELHEVAGHCRQKLYRVVALAGGDGTLHSFINCLRERHPDYRPALLLLPTGTMNLVAKDIGYRGRGFRVYKRCVSDLVKKGKLVVTTRPALKVNGEAGFLYGMGMANRFLLVYDRLGGNKLKALLLSWRIFFRAFFRRRTLIYFNRLPVSLHYRTAEIPDRVQSEPVELNMVLGQTVRPLFFGIKPAYFCVDRKKHFAVIAARFDFFQYARHLFHIFFHWRIKNTDYRELLCDYIRLDFENKQRFYIDGEQRFAEKHTVQVIRPYQFIRTW